MNQREEPPLKSPIYSQAGAITEPALSGLRDQIKKIMIPMLIKIFQLKLDLSQSLSLPSRLQNVQKSSPDATIQELKKLDEDLKLLIHWCNSCRNQVSKALSMTEEEKRESMTTASSESITDPAVSKSFSEAVFAQPPRSKNTASSEERYAASMPSDSTKSTWWNKFFSKD